MHCQDKAAKVGQACNIKPPQNLDYTHNVAMPPFSETARRAVAVSPQILQGPTADRALTHSAPEPRISWRPGSALRRKDPEVKRRLVLTEESFSFLSHGFSLYFSARVHPVHWAILIGVGVGGDPCSGSFNLGLSCSRLEWDGTASLSYRDLSTRQKWPCPLRADIRINSFPLLTGLYLVSPSKRAAT